MWKYIKNNSLVMFLHRLFASSEDLWLFRKISINHLAINAFFSGTLNLKASPLN